MMRIRTPRSASLLPRSRPGALAAVLILAAIAPSPVAGGQLDLRPVEATVCPNAGVLFQEQEIRIVAWGFASGSLVKVYFSHSNDKSNRSLIREGAADGDGKLDAIITIPSGFPTPTLGHLEALGEGGSGMLAASGALFGVVDETSIGGDTDSDGVPDLCDNCPEIPNDSQENSDSSGGGDACDVCPRDSMDDYDGDGLCADVDEYPSDADNDIDGDRVAGPRDNCPGVANSSQLDRDANGIGDACQAEPTCSDEVDNDGDGFTDFPADRGCSDAEDTSETSPDLPCDDGIDNDADALRDYRPGVGDPGCGPDTSLPEDPECNDGIDNDGDGTLDWDGDHSVGTPDPDCRGIGFTASE